MAYEHKDNMGSVFPNDYKTTDSQPDFKGSGKVVSPDGSMTWIADLAFWVREKEDGTTWFSVSMKPKREQGEEAAAPQTSAKPAFKPGLKKAPF